MTDAPTVVAVTAAKDPAVIGVAGIAMLIFGAVIIFTLIVIFWKAQRDKKSPIDMNDLLIDYAVGRMTQGRFWGLIGGAAGLFVFIYLPVSGHFDSAYAIGFMAAVFGLKVAGDITGKPSPGGAVESSIERTAPSGATEKTTVRTEAPPAADLLAAGRGVEKIGPEDVGGKVAIVPKQGKPTTRRNK